jgi:hypothetical protein
MKIVGLENEPELAATMNEHALIRTSQFRA